VPVIDPVDCAKRGMPANRTHSKPQTDQDFKYMNPPPLKWPALFCPPMRTSPYRLRKVFQILAFNIRQQISGHITKHDKN
jgi:hypothetical protein